MLTSQLHEKIAELLKSAQKEMCLLAQTIFVENTDDYRDYWFVRTLYSDKGIIVHEENARASLNYMYNHLNKDTIGPVHNKLIHELRMTSISSRTKRRIRKNKFKDKHL